MLAYKSLEHIWRQRANLDPTLNQVANTRVALPTGVVTWPSELGKIKEVKLGPKGDKVSKEAVKVALAAQVYEPVELRVVDVSKDAKKLLVNVLGSRGKRGRELAAGFCGKGGFVA